METSNTHTHACTRAHTHAHTRGHSTTCQPQPHPQHSHLRVIVSLSLWDRRCGRRCVAFGFLLWRTHSTYYALNKHPWTGSACPSAWDASGVPSVMCDFAFDMCVQRQSPGLRRGQGNSFPRTRSHLNGTAWPSSPETVQDVRTSRVTPRQAAGGHRAHRHTRPCHPLRLCHPHGHATRTAMPPAPAAAPRPPSAARTPCFSLRERSLRSAQRLEGLQFQEETKPPPGCPEPCLICLKLAKPCRLRGESRAQRSIRLSI